MIRGLFIAVAMLVAAGTLPAQLYDGPNWDQQLFQAVRLRDVSATKKALRGGANPNASTLHTRQQGTHAIYPFPKSFFPGTAVTLGVVTVMPLHYNALYPDAEILDLLLRAGADLAATTGQGATALQLALAEGHDVHAERLAAAGSDYFAVNPSKNTSLHFAALSSNPDCVRLAKRSGLPINAVNQHGMSPFHIAARFAPPEVLHLWLDLGAEITLRDRFGFNALHYAAAENDLATVKFLYQTAPSLFSESKAGLNPLDIAYAEDKVDIALYFRRQGLEFGGLYAKELRLAVENGRADSVRHYLAAGANPNRNGTERLLHQAARQGNVPVMEALLAYGADLEASNGRGETALAVAVQKGDAPAAKFLMGAGAVPENSWLAAMIGIYGESEGERCSGELVELVMEGVDNVNVPAGDLDLPPLAAAAYYGAPDWVARLIARGADVHWRDAVGWTALHWATVRRNLQQTASDRVVCMDLLLGAGADPAVASTAAQDLPERAPYLVPRIPAHANVRDLLAYSLPLDSAMLRLLPADLAGQVLPVDFAENGRVLLDREGRADMAIVELNRALQGQPALAEAYYDRGRAKFALAQYESAALDFELAREYRAFYPEAGLAWGRTQRKLGQPAEALLAVDAAIGQGVRTGAAYLLRGQLRLEMGEEQAACKDFRRAAEMNALGAEALAKEICP